MKTALSQQQTQILQRLSEGELWEIATNRAQPRSLRQAAMERWLFPSEYGYPWARERKQKLKGLWEDEDNPTRKYARAQKAAAGR